MSLLAQEDGDLSSCFDKIDEREAGKTISTIKHMLVDSHTKKDKIGKISANLPLEHNFVFAKHSKKIAKSLEFELQLKTSKEKQIINCTTLGGN